jgi:hypothetical protein
MEAAGTVDADADKEVIFFEKLAPLIVQKRAISLQGVLEDHAWFFVEALVVESPSVEVYPHQSGFPPLPGNRHLGAAMVLYKLADVGLQHLVAHAKVTARIETVFVQEKAVGTVQVADGPSGLG